MGAGRDGPLRRKRPLRHSPSSVASDLALETHFRGPCQAIAADSDCTQVEAAVKSVLLPGQKPIDPGT